MDPQEDFLEVEENDVPTDPHGDVFLTMVYSMIGTD